MVLEYALMSNGRTEIMIMSIKKILGRLIVTNPLDWTQETQKALYGYRRRPSTVNVSPFELMYSCQLLILKSNEAVAVIS